MIRIRTAILAAAIVVAVGLHPVHAQGPAGSAPQPAPDPAPDDRAVDPSQPDFSLVALHTTLKVPRFGSSFRVTHRFTRPLGQGDFGDFLGAGLGTDDGAQIGLEYRFGLMSGTQLGFYRTSGDKTIEFFVQQHLLRQSESMPVGVDALVSTEGTNNFRDSYRPAIGAVISRTLGRNGALYVQPMWINNTNELPSELVDDNSTVIAGVGARLRIRPTVYVVLEAAPRFGYRPNPTYASFAIEKRAGGHSFQLNFSNGTGSTLSQVATNRFTSGDDWYFGFNLSRKFF